MFPCEHCFGCILQSLIPQSLFSYKIQSRNRGDSGGILRQSNYLGELANRCFGTWDIFFRVCALMKRQIESSFIKTEWKCHACPLRYQPQNQFLELSKKHLRRGGRWVPLLSALEVDNRRFSFYPPMLEYSLILDIYFPFDFGKVFFFLIVQILN